MGGLLQAQSEVMKRAKYPVSEGSNIAWKTCDGDEAMWSKRQKFRFSRVEIQVKLWNAAA